MTARRSRIAATILPRGTSGALEDATNAHDPAATAIRIDTWKKMKRFSQARSPGAAGEARREQRDPGMRGAPGEAVDATGDHRMQEGLYRKVGQVGLEADHLEHGPKDDYKGRSTSVRCERATTSRDR